MSSDVVLTSALRTNLLSLQNTQRLIDDTQLKLATGLKVNSALDNPQNFFAAQSLDNRAGDLGRLLDGISQSIRTIEVADNGITALTSLINQAQSITDSARDELAGSDGVARALGDVDLSEETDLIANTSISASDTLDIITTDDNGDQISETITIPAAGELTAEGLAALITDTFADNQDSEITASVSNGYLSIESSGSRTFRLEGGAGGTAFDANDFAALGLSEYVATETTGGATEVAGTIVAGNTFSSISLYEGSGDIVEAGDLVTGIYQDAQGATALTGFAAGDDINFEVTTVDGTSLTATINIEATTTFQDVVDALNNDVDTEDYVQASFDSSTGQISFTSVSDDTATFEIEVSTAGAATFNVGLGDPSGNLDPRTVGAGAAEQFSFSFNSSTQELDSLANDYNEIRDQIDTLVQDASYRGINLLNGDVLTTFFNEDRSNTLATTGQDFTANGLGVTEASFRSTAAIDSTAEQARDALTSVRRFGSTISNNLAIIQTRRDFTESTINTLEAGADDLTVADQNEEGANLLALQTRQTLGVTSLSLASQSQQSVLRLF